MSDIRWREQDAPTEIGNAAKAELAEIICTLLDGGDQTRLLELHYWSEEPQLLEIMRIIAALNDETRAALHTFLARTADPEEITGDASQPGQLTLSAPVRCASVLPFGGGRKSRLPTAK